MLSKGNKVNGKMLINIQQALNEKRIFLLPGFGEDAYAFRQLKPYLQQWQLVDIDYRLVLNHFSSNSFSIKRFVERLILKYKITKNDVLIGHSIGGYISYNISQLSGSPVYQIASFTNPKKVPKIIKSNWLAEQFIAFTGLRNELFAQYIGKKYERRASKEEILYVMRNFRTYDKKHLQMLYRFTYQTAIYSDLPPKLRIHALKDRIVYTPDEAFHEVPGDHFCLILHPEAVAKPIIESIVQIERNS